MTMKPPTAPGTASRWFKGCCSETGNQGVDGNSRRQPAASGEGASAAIPRTERGRASRNGCMNGALMWTSRQEAFVRLLLTMTMACLAAGCGSQSSNAPGMDYVRTDGRPIDAVQARATLAQCQGEGARSVDDHVYAGGPIPWLVAVGSRASKEKTITNACMARNGYLAL